MKPQHFGALLVAAVLSLAVAVTAYVSTQPWTAAGNGNSDAMLPALQTSGEKAAPMSANLRKTRAGWRTAQSTALQRSVIG
jgi:hypothetical protein